MAKFLFIVPPFMGHINPTLGLGAGLLKRKHSVAWICIDPAIKRHIPDGGDFLLLETDISAEERGKIENELTEKGKRAVYGLDSLQFLYEEVLIPLNGGMLEEISKMIDAYHPDLIINDHQLFAGAVAAIRKKIPYATSVTAPAAIKVNSGLPGVHQWESEQIIAFQKNNGIADDVRLDCSRQLSIVYTSNYFFGDSSLPDHFQFIGPVIKRNDVDDDFNWESLGKAANRPKILVSIGTTFDHEQKKSFFNKVTEAFENEEITVVVVSDPDLFDRIPDNFHIYQRIPQLKLLPWMDAVVCHGGYNTVCETLSNAKPLVVIPIAYDQSYVAGCVVDRGCGVRLNFNRFKLSHLRDAVHTVLNDERYRLNAVRVQASFDEAGGVSKAISLLEGLLKQKKTR